MLCIPTNQEINVRNHVMNAIHYNNCQYFRCLDPHCPMAGLPVRSHGSELTKKGSEHEDMLKTLKPLGCWGYQEKRPVEIVQ